MADEFYQMMKGISEAASQPLCKLIDAVSAGAGMVYQPLHIRRIAKAKADALVIRSEADLVLSDLRQRAAARLTNTEMRRQENIEAIVEKASHNLPDQCSEEPVNQDWMADFFDCCKDIGSDDVQALWGKLLAGEVTEPGSYSRRALNAVKLMGSVDAALFMVLGFRVWTHDEWPVLLVPGNTHHSWPPACPFQWHHVSALADIDLLERRALSELDFIGEVSKEHVFDYCGQRYVGFTNPLGGIAPTWINFTRLGAELLPLVRQVAGVRDAYFDACKQCFSVPQWKADPSSDFRQLDLTDEIRDSLNLNKPPRSEPS
jgi:hypothetical protein